MPVADTLRELPSNRMVFDARRDPALYRNFVADLEDIMEAYGLSEDERQAFRDVDLKRLGDLGVHPYFFLQILRLFEHGGAETLRIYRKSVVEGNSTAP